ncbi:hypothetical protein K0M31_012728, partial [Melipona bicolor]
LAVRRSWSHGDWIFLRWKLFRGEISRYNTRDNAKCFLENIGKRGLRKKTERMGNPKIHWLAIFRLRVPSNWIRTKSTVRNRFVRETLGERGFGQTFERRESKHAWKGEGAAVLKERSTKSEVASTRRVFPLGNFTSPGQVQGNARR